MERWQEPSHLPKKAHLQSNLKFAQRHLKDPATNRQKVLYSDETKE